MLADEGKASMDLENLRKAALVAVMLLAVSCLGLTGCASTDESSSGSGGDVPCDIDPGQKKCLD